MQTDRSKFSVKKLFSRLTKCGLAALCVVLGFFIVGACTIGGFSSPGKAYFAPAESELVFYLDYEDSTDVLGEIYINVGAVYAYDGEELEFSFRHATAGGRYTEGRFRVGALGTFAMGNIYSDEEGGISGGNYNWVRAFDLRETTDSVTASSYRLIRITVPCDMLINEVAFLDTDGNVIPAYAGEAEAADFFTDNWSSYRDLFHANERETTYGSLGDPANLTDSPRVLSGAHTYTNFTQDEIYTLLQIDNIRLGSILPDGATLADTDAGPLAALLPMPGVLLFGACPFGLRIFPLLCMTAMVAAAYFFGKEMFGRRGFALLLCCLLAGGGLALTVGRLGLAVAPAALFAFLSCYCMFRFFRRGADAAKPMPGARNVLLSGIFFAIAFALDPKSLFVLIPLAALLGAGIWRIARAHRAQLERLQEGAEGPADTAAGSADAAFDAETDGRSERRAAAERAEALREAGAYRIKLIVAFILLGFVAVTAALYILSSLPLYYTYLRLYEADPAAPVLSIFTMIGRAFSDAFTVDNLTAFSAANASSSFGWLIAWKGATLYAASTDSVYVALNAQPNIAMTLTALIAFLCMTAGVVLYFVSGGKKGGYASEQTARILGAYFVLTAGAAASLLQFAWTGGASAAHGLLFQGFYLGYIPLLLYTSSVYENGAKLRVFGRSVTPTFAVGAALVAVYAVVFALSLPMYFSIPLAPAAATACFGWTSFVNNGSYRI